MCALWGAGTGKEKRSPASLVCSSPRVLEDASQRAVRADKSGNGYLSLTRQPIGYYEKREWTINVTGKAFFPFPLSL